MRMVAMMAFFALQLSVFTCGFDIHVHAMNSDVSHIAEHAQDKDGHHNPDSSHHGCHLHASHTFAAADEADHVKAPLVMEEQYHQLLALDLRTLPFRIEHPPKPLHS